MRLFAKPVVLVVLLLAACSPFATPTASPATNASPTTPGSTPGASGSPSTPASLTSPPMWIDETTWTTFFSDRYQFSMGYPSDWTVVPADHDWTLAEDADNWLSTGQEVFYSPTQDIRVSLGSSWRHDATGAVSCYRGVGGRRVLPADKRSLLYRDPRSGRTPMYRDLGLSPRAHGAV
jgi:hypothetical protein